MSARPTLSQSHSPRVRLVSRISTNSSRASTLQSRIYASTTRIRAIQSIPFAPARGQIKRFATVHTISKTRRNVGRIAFTCAALATGFVGGALSACALKTWWYTKAGQSLAEHGRSLRPHVGNNTLDASPIVRSLREQGWIEVGRPSNWSATNQSRGTDDGKHGRHLVDDILTKEKGLLCVRCFRHPEKSISVLAFLADDGLEGWPNVVHGGLTSSLVHEALELHMRNFSGYKATVKKDLRLKYLQPVMTNEVYAITVSNTEVLVPYLENKDHTFAAVAAQITISPVDHPLQEISQHQRPTERTDNSPRSGLTSLYLDACANVFVMSQDNHDMIERDPDGLGAIVQADFDRWVKHFETEKL